MCEAVVFVIICILVSAMICTVTATTKVWAFTVDTMRQLSAQ